MFFFFSFPFDLDFFGKFTSLLSRKDSFVCFRVVCFPLILGSVESGIGRCCTVIFDMVLCGFYCWCPALLRLFEVFRASGVGQRRRKKKGRRGGGGLLRLNRVI